MLYHYYTLKKDFPVNLNRIKSFLCGRIFIGAIVYGIILILLHQVHVFLRSYQTLMNPHEFLALNLDLFLIWIITPLCAFIIPFYFNKYFGRSISKFQLICFVELGFLFFSTYHVLIGYHWYPDFWEYHLQNVGFPTMPRRMAIAWLFIMDVSKEMIILSICLPLMFILYFAAKKVWILLSFNKK